MRRLPIRVGLEQVTRWLLAPLWVLGLVRLGGPLPEAVAHLVDAALIVFLLLAAGLARAGTRFLSLALALGALAAAGLGGDFGDLRRGLENGLIFTAFIPTLAWLRAAAERSPAVAASRTSFAEMTGRARIATLQVGAHLLGAVITAGVFGLFAPLIGERSGLTERTALAQATIRGMALAVLWSPCFVGMAFAARLLPMVPLWQVIPLGIVQGLLLLVLADLMFGLRQPFLIARSATTGFRPIFGPLLIGAGSVLLLTSLTPLSSLEAVLLGLPPLGLLWLLHSGRDQILPAVRDTWLRLGRMADDLLIVIVAMVLAAALGGNQAVAAALAEVATMQLPAWIIIGATLGLILALGLLGLHPMVGVSVLIPLVMGLPDAPVAPLVLMLVALSGWGLGTINSPSSLSIVLASANFRVPLRHLLIGRNLSFVSLSFAITVALLSLLNLVVRA